MTQIAAELGVSPASLYRRLARHRQETEVIETVAISTQLRHFRPGCWT